MTTTKKKPAVKKPAAKKRPATKKAQAARTEKSGQSKVFEWRGLKFDLPPKLPGVFLWDVQVLIEAGGNAKFTDVLNIISALVGEDRIPEIRGKIAEDEVPMEDLVEVVEGLMEGLIGVYGLEMGESSAS